MIHSILLFGTRCDFADYVANRLLERGFSLSARVLPGNPEDPEPIRGITPGRDGIGRSLPMNRPPDADSPVYVLNWPGSPRAAEVLASCGADLAVLCCYPARLPLQLLTSAARLAVNVHPSLLPKHRGPVPLFWVFRSGDIESGVTVHSVDEKLDTGPVLAQEAIAVPVGTGGDWLWQTSYETGADLLIDSIARMNSGTQTWTPQDEALASYEGRPGRDDLVVDPVSWDAWRIHHFCSGVLPLGYRPVLRQGRILRRVLGSHGYEDSNESAGTSVDGAEKITTRDGIVYLELDVPVI